MNSAPKVSVLVVTYNQEPYIAQAIESALMQRTNFPFEIVVGEDCSTDQTRVILRELAQKHPQRIRLLHHERNLGGPLNVATTLLACTGQYVAMLEGDDYWTDPLKLQRQADALDRHADWSACFHVTRMIFEQEQREPLLYPAKWSRPTVTVNDLFVENMICTCSVVFRRAWLDALPAWHQEIVPGDWAIHLLNADKGPIGYLPEVMADYRIHASGLWSRKSLAEKHAEILRMLSCVDHHFAGKYTQRIDGYRIRLVTRLVKRCESVERHNRWLRGRPLVKEKPVPRSATYRLGRKVMRPLEQLGKQMAAAAAGIRVRLG